MSSDPRHREDEGALTEMEFQTQLAGRVVVPDDPGQLGKA